MTRRPVKLLDPFVAQRIAAGEVIDRPQAVIRELIDNAIDADASQIDVYIEQGGIDVIRVIDNGIGMDKEDLSLCCKSHATSKITTVEDLYTVGTLGFRGEALASIAACSKLTIMSSADREHTYTLSVTDAIEHGPVPGGNAKGTTIEVRDLFYSIPGRKKFLKRAQAEAAACKRTFIEKALPFPEIQFRFFSNGSLSLFLPKSNMLQRIIAAYPKKFEPVFFQEIHEQCGSFSLHLVCSNTSFYRNDRSFIQIFVNNRRIEEYALMQAVQYGYANYLPGGCYPYCFVYLEIEPELVDFNIHPAKREVKLRIGKEIHHQLVQTIKQFLFEESRTTVVNTHSHQQTFTFSSQRKKPTETSSFSITDSTEKPYTAPQARQTYRHSLENSPSANWIQEANSIFHPGETTGRPLSDATDKKEQTDDFIYYGQLFGLFLLVERDDEFFFIDQHAAHEKIIYTDLTANITQQQLLVPIEFEVSEEVDRFLKTGKKTYEASGITLKQDDPDSLTWQLTALPHYARYHENDIVSCIQEHMGDAEEIIRSLFATISCRTAVKDGDVIDTVTAKELIRKAFALEIPRCPHGRPIWKRVTREELFKAVRRIL